MTPILRIESLSKSFVLHLVGGKKLDALHSFDLDIEEGEFLALVGRTGSGKSSVLKCIAGVYRPTEGRVLYRRTDGNVVDIGALPDADILELRNLDIGYVSPLLQVVPRVSAVDVVAEPLLVHGMPPASAREEACAILRRLGIGEELDNVFPSTFSTGEKQRVNLARTLITKPRLLLLDEPTSALDPQTKEVIIDVLRELARGGVTVVGVFHDFDVVSRLANRVVALDRGRISSFGMPRDVLNACH